MVHFALVAIAQEHAELIRGDVWCRPQEHFKVLSLAAIPRHLHRVLGFPVFLDDIFEELMSSVCNRGLGWVFGSPLALDARRLLLFI